MYSKVKTHETLALTQALRAVIVSNNVLADHVQVTFEYYKSVHARYDYKTTYGIECLEVEKWCEIIVAERLKEFGLRHRTDKERTVWNWHPLYHMCATNRYLEERLLPLL